MVWGCFWVTPNRRVGRSPLIIMERDPDTQRQGYSLKLYTKTLEKGLLPSYLPRQIFQQDNAPIHNAQYTKNWIKSHGIWTIKWPPYSPDLNPIEHLWWALKRLMHKLHPELATIGDSKEDLERLQAALKEAWWKLPKSLIRRLIESLPRRLYAVRKAKGWQTKY